MSTPSNPKLLAGGLAAVLALAGGVIVKWEGVRYPAYPDPATGGAPWTACYGHTGPDVKPGMTFTKAQCEAFLDADMREADAIVRRCIPVPMLRQIEAALVSATFNIGPSVVCGSTLQRKALANDWPGACAELSRWNKAGGREMKGLVLRRADERALCQGYR
jgi:lysozyme